MANVRNLAETEKEWLCKGQPFLSSASTLRAALADKPAHQMCNDAALGQCGRLRQHLGSAIAAQKKGNQPDHSLLWLNQT